MLRIFVTPNDGFDKEMRERGVLFLLMGPEVSRAINRMNKTALGMMVVALLLSQARAADEPVAATEPLRVVKQNAFAPTIRVAFSPGEAEAEVIDLIRGAYKNIRMMTTSMVNKGIADELLMAKSRGVDVRVLFSAASKDQKSFVIEFLRNSGVYAAYVSGSLNVNSNFVVVDESNVTTGSVDYSSTSFRRNHETVMVVINHPDTAFKLISAWDSLAENAEEAHLNGSR